MLTFTVLLKVDPPTHTHKKTFAFISFRGGGEWGYNFSLERKKSKNRKICQMKEFCVPRQTRLKRKKVKKKNEFLSKDSKKHQTLQKYFCLKKYNWYTAGTF